MLEAQGVARRGTRAAPRRWVLALWVFFWAAVAAFVPVLVMLGFARLPDLLDGLDALLSRVVPRRRRRRARPTVPPVERLAADLHRLSVQIAMEENSREFLRVRRMTAATIAYDDTLRAACRTLEVTVPDHVPLDDIERLETEAALAQRGLVW